MEYIKCAPCGQKNDTKTISAYAFVDDEDHKYLKQWRWNLSKYNYAYRVEQYTGYIIKPIFIMMHREILRINGKNIKGLVVDHEDGNPLNNQKSNLRICNDIQNNQNKKHKATKNSPYKGVKYLKGCNKYRAAINLDLGKFSTAEEASAAYKEASIEIYGKFSNCELRK